MVASWCIATDWGYCHCPIQSNMSMHRSTIAIRTKKRMSAQHLLSMTQLMVKSMKLNKKIKRRVSAIYLFAEQEIKLSYKKDHDHDHDHQH
jgi:uncharacterized protein YcsI (UPF0317 family)